VEVLREGGDGLVPVEQVRVGGGRDTEADATRHRLLRVQSLQLRAEQVRREAEAARRLVKDGHQIVRDDVTICI